MKSCFDLIVLFVGILSSQTYNKPYNMEIIMRNQANKLSVLSLSIAAALCSFTAHAELDPNDATNQSVAAVDLSEQAKRLFTKNQS